MPGHQAVLIRLPHTGPVLLAIDAANMEAELDPSTRLENNGFGLDPTRARDSAQKLFELVKREGVALTAFGHDEHLWPALKKAPEYYSNATFICSHSGQSLFKTIALFYSSTDASSRKYPYQTAQFCSSQQFHW